jgi:Protein of unknown function (DUF3500)
MNDPSDGEYFEAPETIRAMLFATWALLYSLSPRQRQQAEFPLDDPRRTDWDFIPKPDRAGIALADLDRHQRVLAHTLLKSGLSLRGYTQALQIMATENVLRELEVHQRGLGVLAGDFRNPDAYFLSFFGRAGFEDTWAWRTVGHHLSLSYTIIEQRYLTVTPCNMGAQPVPAGLLNPLGSDEDLAFALLHQLPGELRRAAVIHDVAPADYVTRQVPRIGRFEYPDHVDLGIPSYRITDEDREALKFERDSPRGVPASSMPERQREQLMKLICCYVDRAPEEIASKQRKRIGRDRPENMYFCWAGEQERGRPHYYRIQTSDFLIEFDNAIDNGNHIHSVWRDYRHDLGHALLRDHYQREARTGSRLSQRLRSSDPGTAAGAERS